MSRKQKPDARGFVYSTDPGFSFEPDDQSTETLAPSQQKLRIWLDTRQRAGKAVTLIKGFVGTETDLEELGRKLKAHCGTGGSVKDGEIMVQGDHRDKVLQWLQKSGYQNSKKSG